jgi:3-oxoacyl-[acyl-carrier-protein] synthase III
MNRKNMEDNLKKVLKKMKLTEEEAMLFFSHFAKRFINEECYMDLQIFSSNEYEGDSKYANISVKNSIMVGEIALLTSEDSATIRLD